MLRARTPLLSAIDHLQSFQKNDDFRPFVLYLIQHINENLRRECFSARIEEVRSSVQNTWINPVLSAEFIQAAENVRDLLQPRNVEFLFPEVNSQIIARQYESKRKKKENKLESGSQSDSDTKLLEDATEDQMLLNSDKKSKKRYSYLF